MIRDIEDGRVGIVLCKDLSRLGRNNALVAYYTELFFPDNDVRFIAVSNSIDTVDGDNEIMPFLSVVNEYYARDISRKIRSAKRTKALNGEFTGAFAPYGFLKDPENPRHLVIDPEASQIVRRVFQMAADGITPFRIAAQLSRENIPTPQNYINGNHPEKEYRQPKYPEWSKTTILGILHRREYLGHLVSCKYTTKSFKNKKMVIVPEDERIEVQNTHEPIIDQYLFDLAQKVAHVKRREGKPLMENIFAGLLKCSTCGGGLGLACRSNNMYGQYNCNLYRRGTKAQHCNSHYISHKALYALVLEDIRRNAVIARQYEGELTEYAQKLAGGNAESKYKQAQRDLEKFRQRGGEIDTIIRKLFEQNALGVISDERFVSMSADYEREQKELTAKVRELQSQLVARDTEGSNTVKFLNAVRKYSDITELNAVVLNDLIDSIVVYEPNVKWAKASRVQRVDINYKFIGLSRVDESKPK
jgi:DNA invertase Pin-like site-specific DNA recombinase